MKRMTLKKMWRAFVAGLTYGLIGGLVGGGLCLFTLGFMAGCEADGAVGGSLVFEDTQDDITPHLPDFVQGTEDVLDTEDVGAGMDAGEPDTVLDSDMAEDSDTYTEPIDVIWCAYNGTEENVMDGDFVYVTDDDLTIKCRESGGDPQTSFVIEWLYMDKVVGASTQWYLDEERGFDVDPVTPCDGEGGCEKPEMPYEVTVCGGRYEWNEEGFLKEEPVEEECLTFTVTDEQEG